MQLCRRVNCRPPSVRLRCRRRKAAAVVSSTRFSSCQAVSALAVACAGSTLDRVRRLAGWLAGSNVRIWRPAIGAAGGARFGTRQLISGQWLCAAERRLVRRRVVPARQRAGSEQCAAGRRCGARGKDAGSGLAAQASHGAHPHSHKRRSGGGLAARGGDVTAATDTSPRQVTSGCKLCATTRDGRSVCLLWQRQRLCLPCCAAAASVGGGGP
ncbi:uncharacterized protein BJ171DRAFT_501879 [Polychytrium aggregatum]|uniref:uncharacterized protein n=1 Tax=Polychytrium aggregatum TaxID=110093 RepID=UPI0022FEC265|nr:uncharacterized protein BJ171DRAFT_501879 [Polychytrium aggregatum]KAI9205375.1 hypothetical protein BJ171DRAFT_501879 [Polychytrium aggregatum]